VTRILAWTLPVCLGIGIAAWTIPAWGQTQDGSVFYWGKGYSFIRLQPVERKDHIAEVEFKNEAIHTDRVDTGALSIPGLSIGFSADVGRGNRPDFLDVEVPDGFIAVPPSISVNEGETGRILIFEAKTKEAM
jgi:hypothetical protein